MGDPALDEDEALGGTLEEGLSAEDLQLGGTREEVSQAGVDWVEAPGAAPVTTTPSEAEHIAGLARGDYPRGRQVMLPLINIRGSRTGRKPTFDEQNADVAEDERFNDEGYISYRRTLREDRPGVREPGQAGIERAGDFQIPENIQRALRVGGRLFGSAVAGPAMGNAIARGVPDVVSPQAATMGLAQGATLGFSDELVGAVSVLGGEDYAQTRDAVRGASARSEARAPVSFLAGEAGGMAATGPLIPMGGGATAVARVARAAGTGAALGGVGAAGMTEAPLGSVDFARDVGVGTALGGVLGAVPQATAEVVPRAVQSFLGTPDRIAFNRAVNDAVQMSGARRDRAQVRRLVGPRRQDKQVFIDRIDRLRRRGVATPDDAVARLDASNLELEQVFNEMQAGADAQRAAPRPPPERMPRRQPPAGPTDDIPTDFAEEFAPPSTGFGPEDTPAARPSAMEAGTAVDDFGRLDTIGGETAIEAVPQVVPQEAPRPPPPEPLPRGVLHDYEAREGDRAMGDRIRAAAFDPESTDAGFGRLPTSVDGEVTRVEGAQPRWMRERNERPLDFVDREETLRGGRRLIDEPGPGPTTVVEGRQGPQWMGEAPRPPDGSAPLSGPARQRLDNAGNNIAEKIRELAERRAARRGDMPAGHGASERDMLGAIASMFEASGERSPWTMDRLRGHLQQLGEEATWEIGRGGNRAGEEVRRQVYGIVREESQQIANAIDPTLGRRYREITREVSDLIPYAEAAYNDQIGSATLRKVPLTSNIMAAGMLGAGTPEFAVPAAIANTVLRRNEPRIASIGWSAAYNLARVNPTAMGPAGRALSEAAQRGPGVFAVTYFSIANRDPGFRVRMDALVNEDAQRATEDVATPRDTPMGETIE